MLQGNRIAVVPGWVDRSRDPIVMPVSQKLPESPKRAGSKSTGRATISVISAGLCERMCGSMDGGTRSRGGERKGRDGADGALLRRD